MVTKTKPTDAATANAAGEASRLLDDLTKQAGRYVYRFEEIAKLRATEELLSAAPEVQAAAVREVVERTAALRDELGPPKPEDHRYMNLHHEAGFPMPAALAATRLLRRKLPLTDDDLLFLVRRTADLEMYSGWALPQLAPLVALLSKRAADGPFSDEMQAQLQRLAAGMQWCENAPERKLRKEIEDLYGGPKSLPVEAGEAWSDAAIADLAAMKKKLQTAWHALLGHCLQATGSQPSKKWSDAAAPLLAAIGEEEFRQRLARWLPLVDRPRTQLIETWSQYQPNPNLLIGEANADVLKGLVWCCAGRGEPEMARLLSALAVSAYKKVPGIGPRAVKIGNACVFALGAMPGTAGLAQLALLKVKVKFGTAQKGIEKSLTAVAERLGLPREEIDELAVPTYGLEEVGLRREEMGEFTAELMVNASGSTELRWQRSDGKPQKSVPAVIKTEFAADLSELKAAAKDIQKMLPAQRDRIDSLFLAGKQWPLATWRERYLDHPLTGLIARRIIWQFTSGEERQDGIWLDGKLVDSADQPLKLADDATVELWHPIARPTAEVLAWREWLERHQVRQPFKQAHREIYILTDAELRTGSYSNRFAAHILKQHQYNALCAIRGWKNKLRLLVDDSYPPTTRELAPWGLRAEFWVEGAGDAYGVDTNETGTFLYLATDQVRFYQVGAPQLHAHASGGGYGTGWQQGDPAEPMALERVPPLVFSEIMRDVDLFVGVASVGNDPNWTDGGREVRYGNYWNSYSFGELSATAQTRKAVLERIIPRLKIAGRCSFAERFLVVQGKLRTYKIHLGSGNILMEPNDQYLCIVPGRASDVAEDKVFLPFEGDRTLSIVLSKALLLADDDKISDPSITRQIKGN